MITNQLLPIGNLGILQSGANPSAAVLFVCSISGLNNRGRVKFPGATAATTNGSQQGPQGEPTEPLATLAYAATFTKAGRGDIIVVLSGHVETITAAVVLSIAGVTIFGMGSLNSRPIFTLSVANAITITGTGISINNCIFDASAQVNLAADILVSGTGLNLYNCTFKTHTGTGAGISMAAGWGGCRFDTIAITNGIDNTATAVGSAITLATGDGFRLTNSTIHGVFTTGALSSTGKVTDWHVDNNNIRQFSTTVPGVVALGQTTDNGLFVNNQLFSYDASTTAGFIAGAGAAAPDMLWLNNYGYIHKTGGPFSAILVPAAGTIP